MSPCSDQAEPSTRDRDACARVSWEPALGRPHGSWPPELRRRRGVSAASTASAMTGITHAHSVNVCHTSRLQLARRRAVTGIFGNSPSPQIAPPADLVSSVSPPGLPEKPATLLIGVRLAIFNIGSQKGGPAPHCSDHLERYSVEDPSRSKKRSPTWPPCRAATGFRVLCG